MLKLSVADKRQIAHVGNALSTELRINILTLLQHRNMNVVEIASALDTSVSTVASNIRILEESGLVHTEFQPAKRGSMKVCSIAYGDIYINLRSIMDIPDAVDFYTVEMPIGMFSNCLASPTCGMADDMGYVGLPDDPSAFYQPDRTKARTIWLSRGYIEYLLPLQNPSGRDIYSLELEYEACSEAPGYNNDWKSDISLWVNDTEVGVWCSPSDFGDRAGRFNPQFWLASGNSQYGMLNRWLITRDGTHFFDDRVSNVTVTDVIDSTLPYIKVRIGVREDAENQGGVCLFGRGFGDHDVGINMTLRFQSK
jgi:predicted transcriptional regulator